jgi:hypothetical protein
LLARHVSSFRVDNLLARNAFGSSKKEPGAVRRKAITLLKEATYMSGVNCTCTSVWGEVAW